MKTYIPLEVRNKHVFVTLEEDRWLVDTGSPVTISSEKDVVRVGEDTYPVSRKYFGLTAPQIADYVEVPFTGLLGTDVLNQYDIVFINRGSKAIVSKDRLTVWGGRSIPLDGVVGSPVVNARIGGERHKLIFDTGAPITYLADTSLFEGHRSLGVYNDFFPTVGRFDVDTFEVPVGLDGGVDLKVRGGKLPQVLEQLSLFGVQGILDHTIIADRIVGYFPRRKELVVGDPTLN